MPIIKDFKLDFSTRVLIWEITEIESELKSGITFSDELSKKFESINFCLNASILIRCLM